MYLKIDFSCYNQVIAGFLWQYDYYVSNKIINSKWNPGL